jgi:sec-independent protein translocase protein TatA
MKLADEGVSSMVLANFTSPTTWVIIVVVLLLFFGGSKIPEMMRGLGTGMKEFKKGMTDTGDDELERDKREKEEQEKRVRARVEEEMRREADEARRQKGLS